MIDFAAIPPHIDMLLAAFLNACALCWLVLMCWKAIGGDKAARDLLYLTGAIVFVMFFAAWSGP